MEKEKLFNELDKNPSTGVILYQGFEKLRKIGDSINNKTFRERCYVQALENLDKAIEYQAQLQEVFEENSKHFTLCFAKLKFLEEIGRHKMACEYSQEIVNEIPAYSNILLDIEDFCCTLGDSDEAKEFHEIWCKFNEDH